MSYGRQNQERLDMETFIITIPVLINKLGDENKFEEKISIYVRAQTVDDAAKNASNFLQDLLNKNNK